MVDVQLIDHKSNKSMRTFRGQVAVPSIDDIIVFLEDGSEFKVIGRRFFYSYDKAELLSVHVVVQKQK